MSALLCSVFFSGLYPILNIKQVTYLSFTVAVWWPSSIYRCFSIFEHLTCLQSLLLKIWLRWTFRSSDFSLGNYLLEAYSPEWDSRVRGWELLSALFCVSRFFHEADWQCTFLLSSSPTKTGIVILIFLIFTSYFHFYKLFPFLKGVMLLPPPPTVVCCSTWLAYAAVTSEPQISGQNIKVFCSLCMALVGAVALGPGWWRRLCCPVATAWCFQWVTGGKERPGTFSHLRGLASPVELWGARLPVPPSLLSCQLIYANFFVQWNWILRLPVGP